MSLMLQLQMNFSLAPGSLFPVGSSVFLFSLGQTWLPRHRHHSSRGDEHRGEAAEPQGRETRRQLPRHQSGRRHLHPQRRLHPVHAGAGHHLQGQRAAVQRLLCRPGEDPQFQPSEGASDHPGPHGGGPATAQDQVHLFREEARAAWLGEGAW